MGHLRFSNWPCFGGRCRQQFSILRRKEEARVCRQSAIGRGSSPPKPGDDEGLLADEASARLATHEPPTRQAGAIPFRVAAATHAGPTTARAGRLRRRVYRMRPRTAFGSSASSAHRLAGTTAGAAGRILVHDGGAQRRAIPAMHCLRAERAGD